MANPEHLAELQKGVVHWNGWRLEQGPEFSADLRRANLAGLNLWGVNLEMARLEESDLRDANLGEAILRSARLCDCNLGNANLAAAYLGATDFSRAYLGGADLRSAYLGGAILKAANLGAAYLQEANVLSMAQFALGPGDQDEPLITDLSEAIGLTQSQLETMIGDSGTFLPAGLSHPEHWPIFEAPEDDAEFIANALSHRFVFLSYKREDKEWAAQLRQELVSRGLNVWWDDDVPFDANWDDEIDKRLEDATIILTLWTEQSTQSREVKNEALYAMRENKLVQVQRGAPKLGPRYSSIQCADLTGWQPGEDNDNFDRLVTTLTRRVSS